LTRIRAGVQFRIASPRQEDFFFCLCPKTKRFIGPLQNGSVNLGNGNICYVSMNHFEAATATEQQKGIAQKRNPPAHQKHDRSTPHRRCGMWGGAAILKQATAALAPRACRRMAGSEIRQTILQSRLLTCSVASQYHCMHPSQPIRVISAYYVAHEALFLSRANS
jgi:hypothetical protein